MYKYFLIFLSFFLLFNFFIFSSKNLTTPNTTNTNFILPAKYLRITSKFGYRNFTGYKSHFHNGLDLASKENTPVYASKDGIVTFAAFNGAYGYTIKISHDNNMQTMYCHLSKNFNVSVGQTVYTKDLIGHIGPTKLKNDTNYYMFQGEKRNGMTTGPHLHFSMIKDNKFIDPYPIIFN